MDPEDLIFGFSSASTDYEKATWIQIAAHLMGTLSRAVGQELFQEDGPSQSSYGQGFSVDFRSTGTGPAPWRCRVRGTIGAQVIGEELLVRAWVFFYVDNIRLSAPGKGECLVLKYVRRAGAGEWTQENSHGWYFGELGEFDSFEHFEESGRQM